MKQTLEFFPLVVFFAVYYYFDKDLNLSIIAVIISTLISNIILYIKEGRLSMMLLVSTGILILFGGLSLIFQNETFFKMKPTIINIIFALALILSSVLKKSVLKLMLNSALKLTENGWKMMNYLWIGYFLVLAVLNEVVWRTQSTDFWVNFKVFGIMGLTLIFAIVQIPLIKKHIIED